MKTLKLFCISILLFLFLSVTEAQWVQVSNGIGNIPLFSIASSGNYIYSGAGLTPASGVFVTTNNGENWTQTSLNNGAIYSLAANGNYVYAGTNSSGIYLSTDNGTSWNQTSINNRFVNSIAVNGNYVFAATDNYGIYLSTDNGTTWMQTSFGNMSVNKLAVNGNYIFAGLPNNGGVYRSTDNGTSWTQTSLNNRIISSLAVNGNYVFAGTNGPPVGYGIYVSTNNGVDWTQSSVNNDAIWALAVNGNNVYAGSYAPGNKIYVSNDNGTSWTVKNEGLPSTAITGLCISNNYIYATTWYSAYRRQLGEITEVHRLLNEIPGKFSVSQNCPNPFNPSTLIEYTLSVPNYVNLTVCDLLGCEITTLVKEKQNAGRYHVVFDGSNLSSGIYFYKFVAGEYTETKKLILMK